MLHIAHPPPPTLDANSQVESHVESHEDDESVPDLVSDSESEGDSAEMHGSGENPPRTLAQPQAREP